MDKKVKLLIMFVIPILALSIASSFAAWVVKEKQTNFNSITTGCIDLTFTEGTGTLSLQNTIPITDTEGLTLTGYTFNVRNNCNGEISYLLNMDLFNISGSTNLTTDDIKLSIDNNVPRKLSYYEDISKNSNDAYGAKTLYSGKLGAKESDTHTIKMWVDENSTTQNAVFSNRLFTMANPNLTIPEIASDDCFIMDGNGKILMYKTAYCPNRVVIPNAIQGQTVSGVAEGAFRDANVLTIYNSSEQRVDFVILDETNYDTLTSIISGIVDLDIANNGGVEQGHVPSYAIYKASEYGNWNLFDTSCLTGNHNNENINANSHRLNIPLDLDAAEYYNAKNGFIASSFDASYNCSSCYYNGNGPTSNSIENYLESIDFSQCNSLSTFDQLAITYNHGLTKVEVPNNNNNYVFEDSCLANNNLANIFIPTRTSAIKTGAFKENNITYLELYSSNSLMLYSNAFANNNINSLVVNSTIDVSNVSNISAFSNNPLTSTGVTIGYNSTNTINDFINVD